VRSKLLSGIVSAAFGMTAIAGAGAQTISIGVGPAGSVVTKATGPGDAAPVIFFAPDNSWTASAVDASSGADLGSTNITLSENFSGELTIWVTETGVNIGPTPQSLLFLSSFTQNQLPPGASVTESTYFDANDVAFATTTPLANFTFTSIDTNSPGVNTIVDDPLMTAYSITEEYDVLIPISTGPALLSTISLQTTANGPIPIVPEPSTWVMMAIGFAGLGFTAYGRGRRSQPQASIV
jgi:hypothetical protein